MTNCPDDATLRALDEGTLTAAHAVALRRHVDGCDACLARQDALFAAAPPPVERIGRYVVLGPLGEGGMGRVLRAWDPQLSRPCAVKVLKGDARDAEARLRLVREAQAMARVQHPHIVAVFDAGETPAGDVFMAMELVEGPTLDQWLQERPRAWQEVVPVLLDAARGLRAAHAAGLVHRDFKPHNVLLRDGVAKVTDFGLARGPGAAAPVGGVGPEVSTDVVLTQGGLVMGSPAYMAPEHRRGEPDARSDQYSFGATLFEALHGHRLQQPGPLRPVPGWLAGVVRRTLEEEPGRRYPDLGAVIEALERGLRLRRQRWQVGAASMAASALVAFFVQQRLQGAPCRDLDAPLLATWGEPARQAAKRRFAEASAAWGAVTWRPLGDALDASARDWAGRRRASCEARERGATSDATYTLQTLCFDRARGRFEAVVHAAAAAPVMDERTASEAIDALVGQLPDVAACDDAERLVKAGQAESVAQQRAALPLRARIDEAYASAATGGGLQALQAARGVTAEVRAAQNPVLLAEALATVGQLEARFGDAALAPALLREAWRVGLAAGADAVALRAFFELMPGLARDRESLALAQLVAGALIDRVGRRPLLEGELAFRVGQVHYALGDYAAAVGDFEQAVALKVQALGPAHVEVTDALANLSAALVRVDRLDEAIEMQRRVEQAVLERHGPDSILTVAARGALAAQLVAARRDEEARPVLEAALSRLEQEPSADRHGLYAVLDNLAFASLRLGEPERALALRDRLLDFTASALPEAPSLLALAHAWRAEVLLHLGRPEEALRAATTAAQGLRAIAKDHGDLPWPLLFAAEAQAQLGNAREALGLLEEVEPGRGGYGDDLVAQLDLATACVRAPSARAKEAAERARAWFSAQRGYSFEEALARRRATRADPRCAWR